MRIHAEGGGARGRGQGYEAAGDRKRCPGCERQPGVKEPGHTPSRGGSCVADATPSPLNEPRND